MAKSVKFKRNNNPSLPLSTLTMSALFTALTAVLAQVAIPLPFSPVPFTGQVMGILLAGNFLGKRAGLLSVAAYLLLGAAGAPVFSLARGGIHMLTGPSGGYLWGFLPAVFIIGLFTEKSNRSSLFYNTIFMLAALIMIYACGALQLGLVMGYSFSQALIVGVVPFIPLDLLKIFLAANLSLQLKRKMGLNHLNHFL